VAADADDVLREVVARLVSGGYTWAGIFFVEAGELALGPEAGTPDESARSRVPVLWKGERVAELAADGDGAESLDEVAATIGGYCLVGWDTAGEAWEP
jgi:putative methionine-R-sulfoxide reductase with GAF domain